MLKGFILGFYFFFFFFLGGGGGGGVSFDHQKLGNCYENVFIFIESIKKQYTYINIHI